MLPFLLLLLAGVILMALLYFKLQRWFLTSTGIPG